MNFFKTLKFRKKMRHQKYQEDYNNENETYHLQCSYKSCYYTIQKNIEDLL